LISTDPTATVYITANEAAFVCGVPRAEMLANYPSLHRITMVGFAFFIFCFGETFA
jgi:hypothetical protein